MQEVWKIKNPKISYIFHKTLALSNVFDKCRRIIDKTLKEE